MPNADYYRGKLLRMAKDYAKKYPCPKCKNKKRRVVPLYEYGDPVMPSAVVLYCKKCNLAEHFAKADEEQAHAYAKKVLGQEKVDQESIIIPKLSFTTIIN